MESRKVVYCRNEGVKLVNLRVQRILEAGWRSQEIKELDWY